MLQSIQLCILSCLLKVLMGLYRSSQRFCLYVEKVGLGLEFYFPQTGSIFYGATSWEFSTFVEKGKLHRGLGKLNFFIPHVRKTSLSS